MIAFVIFENKPTLFESVHINQDWKTNLWLVQVHEEDTQQHLHEKAFYIIKAWKQDLRFHHHS